MNTPNDARALMDALIASLDLSLLPVFARFAERVQLAKVDRIPICHDIVPRSFQALHFDMGQPLVSESTQTVYLILGLYRPEEAGVSSAYTRVVSIRHLLGQRRWPSGDEVERRLVRYVTAHGDGWFQPCPTNTNRLACFARLLDAVTGREELTHYVNKTTGDWFQDKAGTDGSLGLKNEASYFRQCGLDLAIVEHRICLQPGQLLVIDNLRSVHGRYGKRKPQELYQYLYGVRSASSEDINSIRKMLVASFK